MVESSTAGYSTSTGDAGGDRERGEDDVRTRDQMLKAAANLVESHGKNFHPTRMAKIIRKNLRRGGMPAAVDSMHAEMRTFYGIEGSNAGSYLRALSLECQDNLYVTEWLRKVHGGLPG